jgi:hypothetical protein
MNTPLPGKSNPPTPAAEQFAAFKWLPLPLALAMASILPMKDGEAGKYIKRVLIALATRKRGETDLSDTMLEDAERYSQTKREAAQKRWKKDAGALHLHESGQDSGDAGALPYRQTDRHTDRQHTQKTHEREPEKHGGALTQSGVETPSCEVFQRFGQEQGFDPDRVKKCFRHYEASGWKDAQGQPVKNWQSKLSSWMNRPELASPKAGQPEQRRATQAAKEFPPNAKPRFI